MHPEKKRKPNRHAMGVILRQLFRDFPVQLTIVIICLTISAIVGVVPAVYIERLTGYIEQGLETGWASVLPQMGKAIGTMVALYLVGLACSATYAQLLARITPGFMHKNRIRMFNDHGLISHIRGIELIAK